MGTTDLGRLAHQYVIGRWKRGELTEASRDSLAYTLATLVEVHGNRPVHKLSAKIIDRWLEAISDRAPSTRRSYLSRVRMFCRWLVAQGKLRKDPTVHVPTIRQPRRVPVTLSPAQMEQLRANLPDNRARAIVALMHDVGARCVEVSRLEVGDVDLGAAWVTLRGKAGHERTVPLSASTVSALSAYLAEVGVTAGPLFRNRDHPERGLSAATISHYVRNWLWDAGVKHRANDGRSAHGLRRTCGSEVMEACGDIQVVQALLGHQRPDTTVRHYLRPVSDKRMRCAMQQRNSAA